MSVSEFVNTKPISRDTTDTDMNRPDISNMRHRLMGNACCHLCQKKKICSYSRGKLVGIYIANSSGR